MNKHVYVMVGMTESGDDVGPYVFDFEPSEADLMSVVVEDEWEYVDYYDVTKEGVISQ